MPARPEGCGVVPVASNQRQMDSRIYSPAQCVGQLAENAAAKGSVFNATLFEVAILPQFDTSTRATGTDVGVASLAQALKVLDNGVGFLYEEVEDMLTYGTPDKVVTRKKFGQNNHGLKAVAATLSPACALLFSKSVKADGSIWHTMAAIGSNFDQDGLYNLRRLAWPAAFTGDTVQDLVKQDFYGCGSLQACEELFKEEGKQWATLKNLKHAHKLFREIKGTGVLGIFPFGQENTAIQAVVLDDDIKMQGVSLTELLSKYFVPRNLGLLSEDYWTHFKGFEIKLQVNGKRVKTLLPVMPEFAMSPRIPVTIGHAEHTIVYGPYKSDQPSGDFPYLEKAGAFFYNQNYQTFLTSNSRIMNPLHGPKISDSGGTRTDYFTKNRSVAQQKGGSLMNQLLSTMCGADLDTEAPEDYAELQELLTKHKIFDGKNPHVRIEEYKKQLKNLKWLLGAPFEVYVKVDTAELEFNDAKDDLKDDALRRDSFFASVHAAIALDVLKRMLPGLEKVIEEAKQRDQAAAKAGKAPAAPPKTSAAAKGKAKRIPKAAQQAAEPAQRIPHAVVLGCSLAQAAAGSDAGAAASAAHDDVEEAQQQAAAAPSREERYRARAAGLMPQGPGQVQGLGQGHRQLSALTSPSGRAVQGRESDTAGQKAGKRRKLGPGLFESLDTGGDDASAEDAEGLDMLADAAAKGISSQPSQSQAAPSQPTLTLEFETASGGDVGLQDVQSSAAQPHGAHVTSFEMLWQQALADGKISNCQLTRDIKQMALSWARTQAL